MSNSNPVVISKRVMSNFDACFDPAEKMQWLSGIACYDAEMQIMDDEKTIFLYSTCCEEDFSHYASYESIYDVAYEFHMNNDAKCCSEKKQKILEEWNNSEKSSIDIEKVYAPQFKELDKMIRQKIKERG